MNCLSNSPKVSVTPASRPERPTVILNGTKCSEGSVKVNYEKNSFNIGFVGGGDERCCQGV
jgi:hypothetical protein